MWLSFLWPLFPRSWLNFLVTLDVARRNARSDPPPTEGVQGVLDQGCKLALDPSLFLSPGGRAFRRADPQILQRNFFLHFFSFFLASKTHFDFCFEKSSKKMRKRGLWRLKNCAKPSPKQIQIEVPKNGWFFRAFSTTSFKNQSLETLKIWISPRREHDF